MKTTIKKLSALALSVFALTAYAQCPSITGFNVTQGSTATTTIVPIMSGTVNPSQTNYYWQISPSATVISNTQQSTGLINFPGNGTYTVCLQYNDSTTMCSGNTCTLVTITTSTVSTNCNASFTNYQDSSCITHFVNSSTGSNLTYQWYDMSGFNLLSTQQNPALNLGTGNHFIALYVYASGQFCDSTTASINVSCTNTVSASCHAGFTFSTDSNCVTHFVNTSTGTNLTYEWYDSFGSAVLSTLPNPSLSLGQGNHYIGLMVFSGGQFCDTIASVINIACTGGTVSPCNASFTAYVDSTCITHLVNSSTGLALSYQWYDMFSLNLLSTQQNPSLNLTPGVHAIGLYVYSSGQFCDSMSVSINVNCPGGGTTGSCHANSQFSVFADSTHAGNYFAYNQSSGTGTTSYLWSFGDASTSNQPYPFHQYASPGHYVICLTVTATSGTLTCSDVYCDSSSVQRIAAGHLMNQFTVLPQSATGLQEQQTQATLKVYPNPIENELTIEVQASQNEQHISYVLTDALGKTVSRNSISSLKTTISTGELDKGIYFLSVLENNRIIKTTKLIK